MSYVQPQDLNVKSSVGDNDKIMVTESEGTTLTITGKKFFDQILGKTQTQINGALANFDISIESPRCNIYDGAISKCTKIGIKTYSVSCRIKFGTAKGSEGDNDLYVTLPYFNGYTTQDSCIGTGTYYVDETYNGMVFVGVWDNKLQLLFPNLILKRRVKPNDITNRYFNINCIIQDCR